MLEVVEARRSRHKGKDTMTRFSSQGCFVLLDYLEGIGLVGFLLNYLEGIGWVGFRIRVRTLLGGDAGLPPLPAELDPSRAGPPKRYHIGLIPYTAKLYGIFFSLLPFAFLFTSEYHQVCWCLSLLIFVVFHHAFDLASCHICYI